MCLSSTYFINIHGFVHVNLAYFHVSDAARMIAMKIIEEIITGTVWNMEFLFLAPTKFYNLCQH